MPLGMDFFYAVCILVQFRAAAFAAAPFTPPSLSLLNSLNINLTAPFSVTQSISSK